MGTVTATGEPKPDPVAILEAVSALFESTKKIEASAKARANNNNLRDGELQAERAALKNERERLRTVARSLINALERAIADLDPPKPAMKEIKNG